MTSFHSGHIDKYSYTLLVIVLLILSCNTEGKAQDANAKPDTTVALKFINDYVLFCIKNRSVLNYPKWIKNNKLATDEFKALYIEMTDAATKDDSEVRLEFDPIFNAQDFPDKGFSLSQVDEDGYITVKGKGWPDFKTVIKMKSVGGKWMVDGAGVVNIPRKKQVKR